MEGVRTLRDGGEGFGPKEEKGEEEGEDGTKIVLGCPLDLGVDRREGSRWKFGERLPSTSAGNY